MPYGCAAFNCTARLKKGQNIKFHSFPRDEKLKEQWIKAVGRIDFEPSSSSKICSQHFQMYDYYVNVHGTKTLRKGAIPSNFSFLVHRPVKLINESGLAVCNDKAGVSSMSANLARENMDEQPETESITPTSSTVAIENLSVKVNDVNFLAVLNDEAGVSSISANLASENIDEQPETESLSIPSTSSTVAMENVPPRLETNIRKRKRSLPVYMGDFVEADLENPFKRRRYWEVSQSLVKKLRKSNREYSSKVSKMKKKITDLSSLLDDLKRRFQISSESSVVLKECVPQSEKQLLERQLKGASGKFPPELRSFALTLNFYSSSAYNFVRRTFGKNCLPHPRTLLKWCSSIDGSPGYTSEAIRAVKVKVEVEKAKGKNLIAGLMMDEMSIKEHVEWTGSRHVGYIDFGTGIQDSDGIPRAKNALVFMLVGLNAKWKIPIAYFLIETLTAEEKANLVNGCLIQMNSTGIIIKSLTFDGAATNMSMCSVLGANLSWPDIRPYFMHPITNERIHIFLDACHMIKLCRNTLGDWQYLYNAQGQEIRWSYFCELVKIQNESGLHAATRIRNRHLNYHKEKMRVKLAAEMFSASVADAIEYCDKDLDIPQFKGSEALVEYCRYINDIFDILNSRNFLNKNIVKKPLCPENECFIKNKIETSIEYLSGLKDLRGNPIVISQRKTGYIGLIICLISVRNLFDELIKTEVMKFLCTYKLSQDHLEMFFSVMRSRGGFNNNPTAMQFEGAYKRILIHSELQSSEAANCLAQDNTSILNVASSNIMNRNFIDSLNVEVIEAEDLDNMVPFQAITNSMYYSDIVAYIAGFVSRRMTKRINCETCAQSLTSTNTSSALLVRKNRGGLCKPSSDVVKICMVAESIVRSITNFSRNDIINRMIIISLRKLNLKDLFINLTEHSLEQDPLSDHVLQLVKLILSNYFTIRLHHINSTANEVDSRIRQRLTKMIHFNHQ